MHTTQRIATTHVGSLPRSKAVAELLFARERNEPHEETLYEETMAQAVSRTVELQKKAGVDFISDGETSKISYATYVKDRYTGFEGDSPRNAPQDLKNFPSFLEKIASSGGTPSYARPQCTGPVALRTATPLLTDIANLKRAATAWSHAPEACFMNAASPGVVALFLPNRHYSSHEAYLEALASALRSEYKTILDHGLMLQIDCPDLALARHMVCNDFSDAQFIRRAEQHVEVLNGALADLPADRIRVHVCWGNYEGPHTCDIEMALLFPVLMKLRARMLLFEASNPRHAHEWEVFETWKHEIPEDKILIPGVIDSTTNFVEHPRLVAQRLKRFAAIVGPDRVMAGTDCGFGTFAGFGAVDAAITYEKLASLAAGAKLASWELFAPQPP